MTIPYYVVVGAFFFGFVCVGTLIGAILVRTE